MAVPTSIRVDLCIPAELQVSSPLAKALIREPGSNVRGWARVRRKARRWLFYSSTDGSAFRPAEP
jgi:hypothetical protein